MLIMPIIRSAKKKVRKDKKRQAHNLLIKDQLKRLIKTMRKSPSGKNLKEVFSRLDKAAKTHLIHSGKASRLKSRLSKLL